MTFSVNGVVLLGFFFHDALAADPREQICGKKFWTKMSPGHVTVKIVNIPRPTKKNICSPFTVKGNSIQINLDLLYLMAIRPYPTKFHFP